MEIATMRSRRRMSFIVILLLGVFSLPTAVRAQDSCATAPAGLVAWWTLDETSGNTVSDIVGGYNGITSPGDIGPILTENGPAPVSEWFPAMAAGGAKVGSALYFWTQAQDRYVLVSDDAALRFGTSDFSIDAWVFITQYSGTDPQPIVEKMRYSGTSPDTGYRFFLESGVLTFTMAWGSGEGTVQVGIGDQISQGAWHHVAVTVDREVSSATVNLYINGALSETDAVLIGSGISIASTEDLVMGGSILGNQLNYLDVGLDEVDIFSAAISGSDVLALFNADSLGKCTEGLGLTSVLFQGVQHDRLGSALLTNQGDSALIIRNLGSSGEDGVRISLPDTAWGSFITASIDSEVVLPDSALFQRKRYATVSGTPDQLVGTAYHRKLSAGVWEFLVDDSPLGATAETLKVYFEDSLIFSQVYGYPPEVSAGARPNQPGSRAALALPVKLGEMVYINRYAFSTAIYVDGMLMGHTWDIGVPKLGGGVFPFVPTGTADTFQADHIEAVSNALPGLNAQEPFAVELTTENLSSVTVTEEVFEVAAGVTSTVFQGAQHDRLGSAILSQLGDGRLSITNIGSSGEDGVRITLPDTAASLVITALMDTTEPIPDSAVVRRSAYATVNGNPGTLLGTIDLKKVTTDTWQLSMSNTLSGSTPDTLRAYRNDTLVRVAPFPRDGFLGTFNANLGLYPVNYSYRNVGIGYNPNYQWIKDLKFPIKVSFTPACCQIEGMENMTTDEIDYIEVITTADSGDEIQQPYYATFQAAGIPEVAIEDEVFEPEEGYSAVVIGVESGWNLASVPVQSSSALKDELFPTATSSAYAFAGSYLVEDTLEIGHGYWLKFQDSEDLVQYGATIEAESVDVRPGWNITGSISSEVSVGSIGSVPPGLVTSSFFAYSTAGGYSTASVISPGKGYWVKTAGEGTLILSSSAASPSTRIRIVPSEETPPPPPLEELPGRDRAVPRSYSLDQSYPNPFNPTATIRFGLPEAVHVSLRVYDVMGRELMTILDQQPYEAGVHSLEIRADHFASGVYFYRLTAQGTGSTFSEIKKMILLK